MTRNLRVITLGGEPTEPSAPVADTTSSVIDVLARQIRLIYCTCYRDKSGNENYGTSHMPKWDGGRDAYGSYHSGSTWVKIAQTVMQCEADPFSFIHLHFAQRTGRLPTPNMLHGAKAIELWESNKDSLKEAARRGIEASATQLKIHLLPLTKNLGWDYSRALRYVLMSPRCYASPLTRYCAAAAVNDSEMMAVFRHKAMAQYMFQADIYDELVGDQIPGDFKSEAHQIRSLLLR